MKIELFGKKELVFNACAEECDAGLIYIINAYDRNLAIHRSGGGCLDKGSLDHREKNETFTIYNPDNEDERCEVVFIAENDHERELMIGDFYTSMDDEQMVAICLKIELEKTCKTIVSIDFEQIHGHQVDMEAGMVAG